jgi:hypothetical protein
MQVFATDGRVLRVVFMMFKLQEIPGLVHRFLETNHMLPCGKVAFLSEKDASASTL